MPSIVGSIPDKMVGPFVTFLRRARAEGIQLDYNVVLACLLAAAWEDADEDQAVQ